MFNHLFSWYLRDTVDRGGGTGPSTAPAAPAAPSAPDAVIAHTDPASPAAPAVTGTAQPESPEPVIPSQATPGLTSIHADHRELGNQISAVLGQFQARLAELNNSDNGTTQVQDDPAIASMNAAIAKLLDQQDRLNASMQRVQTATSTTRVNGRDVAFGEGVASQEYWQAFNQWARGRRDSVDQAAATVGRIMAADPSIVGSNPDGGFLVPTTVGEGIDRVIEDRGRMEMLAESITIGTDAWKKLVVTGKPNVEWVDELSDREDTDSVKYSQIIIDVNKMAAKPMVSEDMLEDPMFDFGSTLIEELGISFSKTQERAFVRGTGEGQPRGILTGYKIVDNANWKWKTLGRVKTGVADGFPVAADDQTPWEPLVNALVAMDEAYEDGCSWVMTRKTEGFLRTMTDKDGKMIWQMSPVAGTPRTILNHPVVIDDFMDEIAANNYPIALVSPGGYAVINRRGMTVIPDRVTKAGYTKFITSKRIGGGVKQYEKIKLIQVAA